MRRNITTFTLTLLAGLIFAASGQSPARVAGLENNEEYMELIRAEDEFKARLDSLNTAIRKVRAEFRENSQNRDYYSAEILRLEGDIFDVRNQTGIIAGRISAIEQEFLLQNLGGDDGSEPLAIDIISPDFKLYEKEFPNLAENLIFAENLNKDDLTALRKAQTEEAQVAALAKQYLDNYTAIKSLEIPYAEAKNADEADSIYSRYRTLSDLNTEIAEAVGRKWEYIYDNKTFAYNYILEKNGKRALLNMYSNAYGRMRDNLANNRSEMESGDMYEYFTGKELLLLFEKEFAESFYLRLAADSVSAALRKFRNMERAIPRIELEERLFLDYSDITFGSTAYYNSRNPIPQTTLYPKGVIYRILLGSYKAAQSPNIFRGVQPLSYLRDSDGRYNYYTGGFASYTEAEKAVETLRAKGFRNPIIIVWENGHDSTADVQNEDALFSIEIETRSGTLPGIVKELIDENAEGKDISKAGNTFIVGPFEDRNAAERIVSLIRESSSEVTVKTTSPVM